MSVANTNAYQRYLNGSMRLPANHFPALQTNSSGELILAPGEVYCRFRRANGELCSKGQQFSSHSNLRTHYRQVHKVTIELGRPGAKKTWEIEELEDFFEAIASGASVAYNPRKAKGQPYDVEEKEYVDDRERADEEEEEGYDCADDDTRPHEDLYCVPRREDGVRDRIQMLANAGRKAGRVCSLCLAAQRARCPPRRPVGDCKVWRVHYRQ